MNCSAGHAQYQGVALAPTVAMSAKGIVPQRHLPSRPNAVIFSHMARVAPEKQTRPLPACVFFTDGDRTIMKLHKDALTEIYVTEFGLVAIEQPEEECPSCQEENVAIVMFSAARARVIAAELIRLADQEEEEKLVAPAENPGVGFVAWCDEEDKKCATTAL